MLTEPIADGRAWRAATIDPLPSWTFPLPDTCLSALDRAVRALRERPVTELDAPGDGDDACRRALQPVRDALDSGRGFAILDGLPLERYSPRETQGIYWMTGQLLGRPFGQDVKGTLLYDVRDTGQQVAQGARFSVTNAESSFHTDNAFGKVIPDYVGLLCLATAKSGGLSQLVSACAVHNELFQSHPDALQALYGPFHFDRRGVLTEGEPPTSSFPVFCWDGHELTMRYLHYYIQVGHERAGQPLTLAQQRALEAIEGLLPRPDFRVEFALRPGQMLFTNNRWILHNRTAFEDYPEPERRRHYIRFWLRREA